MIRSWLAIPPGTTTNKQKIQTEQPLKSYHNIITVNTKYCPSRPSQPKRPPRHGHPFQHPYPSCWTDNGDISNPPFSPAQKPWLAQPAYGDCHACDQKPWLAQPACGDCHACGQKPWLAQPACGDCHACGQKPWQAQPACGDCHACGQDPGILPVPAVFIPLTKSLLSPANCHSFSKC